MKISKTELIEMDACKDGLKRFIKQTNNSNEPVEVSYLVGGVNTYSDLLWLAGRTVDKSKIIRFACDCALINIRLIKPYTNKYDTIVDFLNNPTAAYAAVYTAARAAAANAAHAVVNAAYAVVNAADAAYDAANAAYSHAVVNAAYAVVNAADAAYDAANAAYSHAVVNAAYAVVNAAYVAAYADAYAARAARAAVNAYNAAYAANAASHADATANAAYANDKVNELLINLFED